MTTTHSTTAHEFHVANQHYLVVAMDVVRARLRLHCAHARNEAADAAELTAAQLALDAARDAMPTPATLERISRAFQLSTFEEMLLLLCAAVELDATFGPLCASAQADPNRTQPTFGLALAALPNPHWSAVTPVAPLRRWHLLELSSSGGLVNGTLRIDERILHYVAGVDCPDERISALVDPPVEPGPLVPSHHELAHRLSAAWAHSTQESGLPVAQLCGEDAEAKRQIALVAVGDLGLSLKTLRAEALPTSATDLATFSQLWNREAILGGQALMLDCHGPERSDTARWDAVSRLADLTRGVLLLATRDRWNGRRRTVTFDVNKPSTAEQRAMWNQAMGDHGSQMNGHLEHLVSQFNLGSHAIQVAWADARGRATIDDGAELSSSVWDACRTQARPRLDDLAQRIDSAAGWDDLVLPAAQRQVLRDLAAHVRQRAKVYETWGFAAKGARGLGITALFAGASGTGKTMAAEVIARDLRLDLYRIDLSSVVSKYIGETEKNLRRIFDAAEDGGAVLLFDEADALFGKRSEVKDSHDRYANIEVSYLLQRMEAYRGLAILTTNLKSALDTAFLRRIRFIVQFPFPDAVQRAEIWRRVFPSATPTLALDFGGLSRLSIAGGNIHNIALNAAFLAADADEPVHMEHLLRAAQTEYAKLEKPLTEAEFAAWAHVDREPQRHAE
jgi:hypothetical protein